MILQQNKLTWVTFMRSECVHVCVLPPGAASEEILDEGSD